MSGQVVCFSAVALTSQLFDIFCGFTSFQLNIYIFRNNFYVIYLTPFIFHNSCVSKNNSTVIKERMFKYVIFKTKLFTLWYICSWKYNIYCVLISFFFFWLFVYVVLDFKVQSCYITVTFIKVHIIDLYIYLCVWTYELFDKIYSLVSMILLYYWNKTIIYFWWYTCSFLKYWHQIHTFASSTFDTEKKNQFSWI